MGKVDAQCQGVRYICQSWSIFYQGTRLGDRHGWCRRGFCVRNGYCCCPESFLQPNLQL
jgi:hypothetical protein